MIKYITIMTLSLMVWGSAVLAQEVEEQETICPTGYICTQSDTNSNVNSTTDSTTTVLSPPPSAISPSINTSNSDLCTIGISGAVQTQILGISAGGTFTEENCQRLKNAKVLYDMGMKVAAVSVMCEDPNVFTAMMNAGTPCPFDGLIGDAARAAWRANEGAQPQESGAMSGILGDIDEETKSTAIGAGAVGGLLLLLFAL